MTAIWSIRAAIFLTRPRCQAQIWAGCGLREADWERLIPVRCTQSDKTEETGRGAPGRRALPTTSDVAGRVCALRLKYYDSIADAVADLGKPDEIGKTFTGFQKHLYASLAQVLSGSSPSPAITSELLAVAPVLLAVGPVLLAVSPV